MTQEHEDLLLKDLCARLPYGVILNCCEIVNEPLTLISHKGLVNNDYDIDEVKPYLFPLSSMTEEQKLELQNYVGCEITVSNHDIDFVDYSDYGMDNWNKIFNWLNKNHFDYRGLIEKGLANDATGKNIY